METLPETTREPITDGIRLALPPRSITPGMRVAGVCAILFGLGLLVFACFWLQMTLGTAFPQNAPAGPEAAGPGLPLFFRIFLIAFAAIGLLPLGIGLGLVVAGSALVLGGSRCEVGIGRSQLLVREYLGWLRWTFRRRIADLTGLRLGWQEREDAATCNRVPELVATCRRGRPLRIAAAYPVEALRRLATELGRELPQVPVTDGIPQAETAGPTPAPAAATQAPEPPDPGPPPAGVTCQPRPGGLTLEAAPSGIWKGARFFVGFATFWLLITAAVSIPMVLSILAGKPIRSTDGAPTSPWFLVAFLSLFWAVGLGMLAAAIHIGTRRTTIVIGDGLLVLTVISRLRQSRRQWPLETVGSVAVGPSGTSVNDRPLPCLHLRIGDATIKTLTAWNEDAERRLAWIATVLSTVLARRAQPPGAAPAEMPSSLVLDPGQDDWAVVPGFAGKGNAAFSGLMFSVIWLIFVGGFLALVFGVFTIDGSGRFIFGCFLGLFAMIGLALLGWSAWSLLAPRRLAITAGRLTIQEGRRRLELDRAEVLAVICEPNGSSMNDQPFYRLAIRRRDGSSWTCLSGRPESELRWLAAELNRRLAQN